MLKEINVYDVNKLVHKYLLHIFPHLMIYLKIYDMAMCIVLLKFETNKEK